MNNKYRCQGRHNLIFILYLVPREKEREREFKKQSVVYLLVQTEKKKQQQSESFQISFVLGP